VELARKWVQALWFFLANGFWGFPITGTIYQGPLKIICSPGLNCYSCPAATTYCPIGSLQQLLLGIRFSLQNGQYFFGSFVLGSMGMLGAVFGRLICGWACPFGFLQELLYKIPSIKISIPAWLRWLKYGFLSIFPVILFPIFLVDNFGYGDSYFCRYLCPAGTLEAGITLPFLLPTLKKLLSSLYMYKVIILLVFLMLFIVSKRPFCRFICPLGAIYSLFNKFSFLKLKKDETKCTNCTMCIEVCPMELNLNQIPNSTNCIRCFNCIKACPEKAIMFN